MPVRRTFRWPRSARLATFLLVAAAIVLPLAQPTPAHAADEPIRHRGSGDVYGALLVQLRPGVTSSDAADVLSRARATELGRFDDSRVRVVSVPPAERASARRLLLADPRVERVEDDAIASTAVTPSDPHWDQQWNMRRVRGTDAWETTRGDASVIIAIVDTGVDGRHPDLRGRMVRGWDFHNDDANPYDDDGHGTAVATTAAAAGNDGVGIAGACWRCRTCPSRFSTAAGTGRTRTSPPASAGRPSAAQTSST